MHNPEKIESTWAIPLEMHGMRADLYLKRRVGRISRSRAQRIIEAQDFLLDNQHIKPSIRVKSGQIASLKRFSPDNPSDIDEFYIEKIFENDDILVINKPAGLNIHPTANSLHKTLTRWLRNNYPLGRVNPCHRIDKETSGLVVCAKSRAAESHIKKAFMFGRVKKTYLAVVNGIFSGPRTIDLPLDLQKDRGLVSIRMIHDPAGKAALTTCRRLLFDEEQNRSLVLCQPKTGRQHQIRAHLSLVGHPIVGDKLYAMGDEFFDSLSQGKREVLQKLEHHRHALHACKIRLPYQNRILVFSCPIPKDFHELMQIP